MRRLAAGARSAERGHVVARRTQPRRPRRADSRERARRRPQPQLPLGLAADRSPVGPRVCRARGPVGAGDADRAPGRAPRAAHGHDLVPPAGAAAGPGLGPERPAARRYARAPRLPFHRLPWMAGTAPNWQNHRLSGDRSFVVELRPALGRAPRSVTPRRSSNRGYIGENVARWPASNDDGAARDMRAPRLGEDPSHRNRRTANRHERRERARVGPRGAGGVGEAVEALYRRHWRPAYRAAYLVVHDARRRRGHRAGGIPRGGARARSLRPAAAVRPVAASDRREPRDRLVAGAGAAARRSVGGVACRDAPAPGPGAADDVVARARRTAARAAGRDRAALPARLHAGRDRQAARASARHRELAPAPRPRRARRELLEEER